MTFCEKCGKTCGDEESVCVRNAHGKVFFIGHEACSKAAVTVLKKIEKARAPSFRTMSAANEYLQGGAT